MPSIVNTVLDILQNRKLLGFPYLYWAISATISILLCCCICCWCTCCRKKKNAKSNEKRLSQIQNPQESKLHKHSIGSNSGSMELTTIDMKTRTSMAQYNEYKKQQNELKNAKHAPITNYKPERTYAGLKPAKNKQQPNNNNYPSQNNNTYNNNRNNQNQYGNNNNTNYNDNSYGNNSQNEHRNMNQNQYANNNAPNNNYNNQNQFRNDNNYRNDNNKNQYGNNYDNHNANNHANNYDNNHGYNGHNNGHNGGNNRPQMNQNQNNNYGNDNNKKNNDKNKSEFGVQIPKSIYHPISVKNVFNAKGGGSKFAIPKQNKNHGHVYDQYKYSHSPQPPSSQTYQNNLSTNNNNNYPSNSAPPPNTNQIQQQYPPQNNYQNNNGNNNNKPYTIQKLGGDPYHKKKKKFNKKNKKIKHMNQMSGLDENQLKKQKSKAAKNMKLDIHVDEDDQQPSQQQIMAPPKRNRDANNDGRNRAMSHLSTVESPKHDGDSYGGLSAPTFRKKKPQANVNPDDYSDSEERAKISQWDARRSSVLMTDNQVKVDPFQGRRKSVFDESSSDEEEIQNNGRRLTVDVTNAKNYAVSGNMGNLGDYQ